MRARVRVILPGTVVKVRGPRPGHREQGSFIVVERQLGTHPNTNPAYVVRHERSGAERVFRADRLRVTRRMAEVRPGRSAA
jgi:hypothetical protein